ncbi:hypothetical protein I4F81_009100 [Pyropia yezoensis]|uniref:Uncharacterized protein n=1 Tax=Pyropia yezoensis TaxID=2788 RepID=A0ACC3C8H0_PYRYE|nr:hypothetical protein I4F81_009100 [Neopyropia yezoensis]
MRKPGGDRPRRRTAGRVAAASTAAAAAAAAAVAVLAGGAPPPVAAQAQGGVPPLPPHVPVLPFFVVGAIGPFVARDEVPFQLRATAAFSRAWFNLVPVYSDDTTILTADGDEVPLGDRAPAGDRNDDALALAAAGSMLAIANHLYGAEAEASVAGAAAAALGVTLPLSSACAANAPPAEAACHGHVVARRVITDRLAVDGFNEAGTDGGRTFNPMPFADVATNYTPVNSADRVRQFTRWVPLVEDIAGRGTYTAQRITAPQASRAMPAILSAGDLKARAEAVPRPYEAKLRPKHIKNGCPPAGAPKDAAPEGGWPAEMDTPRQATLRLLCDESRAVLAQSAALNDTRRALARWFDSKLFSLGPLVQDAAVAGNLTLPQLMVFEHVSNGALYDAMILIWRAKLISDAIRPPSVMVPLLGGDTVVTADGGPTAPGPTALPLAQWEPFLRTMPHSEYPSASACLCKVGAEIFGQYVGGVDAPVPVTREFPVGFSGGGVPATDLTVTFGTPAEIGAACSASRLWGGVHFRPAIGAGEAACDGLAAEVAERVACLAGGAGAGLLPPCAR